MDKIKFNIKDFKDNMIYIVSAVILIVIALVFSFLVKDYNYRIEEEALPASGTNDINKLIINEIMSNNGGTLVDEDGHLYDWIELYNGKNHAINLLNYALSDNNDKIKWVFPDVTIEPDSYLIIYLSGTKQEGLYAPFKLKGSGGEDLILRNNDNTVIDAVNTSTLKKNEVMFRNLNGEWKISTNPTPGFPNTEEGLKAYRQSLLALNDDIKINEVLPRNKGNFKNLTGDYSGYIELINTSSKDINLSNYSLSNNINNPFLWKLPNITLSPQEIVLIYTSGLNTIDGKEYNASFTLDKEVGEVVLSKGNKVVNKLEYKNIPNGVALINIKDKYYQSSMISPGFSNDTDGIKKFSEKYLVNPKDIIISEVMSSNFKYLPQNGNKYYDWIEVKNNSDVNINLKDYCLTTNSDDPDKWCFSDKILKPGEYYVVMASGDTNLSNNSYVHTNFNLGDIQALYLYKQGTIIDNLFISNIPTGYSLGRSNTNGFYYYSNPTPGQSNSNGLQEVSYAPSTSVAGGVYNDVDKIEVVLDAPGTIYYTLDGSNPTASSSIYSGPLLLNKTTVLKAINIENGKYNSDVLTTSYIINENHTLPVLSIAVNPSSFNAVNSNMNSTTYEVAAYAELFEGDKGFSIPCGLKLFGGSTRFMAKKSYALKFRKQYGASELNYQVFENRDFSSFESLVIRSGSQDYDNAFIRDVLMTSIVDDYTDVDVQAYKTVVLYINGRYWGLYDIREKVDVNFVSSHYNVSPEKTNILRIDGNIAAGTAANYNALIAYIRTHDLANPNNYNYVKERVDIANLIDYWIAEIWVANWDIVNVRYFQNPNIDNNKWKFIYYDTDTAMHNIRHDYYTYVTSQAIYTNELLANLFKNKEFKDAFLTRLNYNLKNVWTTDNVLKRIDELVNKISGEIPRERSRWNLDISSWTTEIEKLRTFAKERPKYVLSTTKSFFRLSDADMKKYFGDFNG